MPGFLYYAEDAQLTAEPQLRAGPLAYALGDCDQLARGRVQGGPGGTSGILLGDGDLFKSIAYDTKQTWRRIPGQQGLWVGLDPASRPAPAILLRDAALAGAQVKASDGSQWLVPHARRWEEFDGRCFYREQLPCRKTLGDDGRWRDDQVQTKYERLWQLACQFADAFLGAQHDDEQFSVFTYDDLDELAIEALRVNYRVAAAEIDLLGFYDQDFATAACKTVIDAERLLDLIKKKAVREAAIGDSPSGPPAMQPDEIPATVPP